jgi:multicomponent Na+:H+ antiporter subunit B
MRRQSGSLIVILGARFLSPYIMMFGLYVIFHGHYSPGGGFQGGTLLAASVLLVRIAGGRLIARRQIEEFFTTPLAAIGVVIYFTTGILALLGGGCFLDYGSISLSGINPVMLRYYGILIIEIGVGLAVMSILIMIYDNMAKGEDFV